MVTEEWIIEACLIGEFELVQSHVEDAAPIMEGLRKLTVCLEEDKNGKLTGRKKLAALLALPNVTADKLPPDVVYGRAREVANNVAAVVALSAGRQVQVVRGSIVARHSLGGHPEKYRCILGDPEFAVLSPPVPLEPHLLGIPLNDKLQRVVRWWARGLSYRDPVDRFIALNSALDMLANMREGEKLGTGATIKLFLTEQAGIDAKLAKAIYDGRNALAHGWSFLTDQDRHRYAEYGSLLVTVIRDGVAAHLGVTLPKLQLSPIQPDSALWDIEYIEPSTPPMAADLYQASSRGA